MNCQVEIIGSVVTVRQTRVKAMPSEKDNGEKFQRALSRVRQHQKRWVKPSDATLILGMHFATHSVQRGRHYAEVTLEIPVKGEIGYSTITAGAKTRADALLGVIQKIESSQWFHVFKEEGVYFRVTGAGMEKIYRGYL